MKRHTAKRVLAGVLGGVLLGTSVPFTTATAADAETGAVIYSSDFEDTGESLPFTGRGGVESISITSSQAHGGSSSMMVSDRAKGWHGPQLLVDDICQPNKEYTISAFAKTEWYNSVKLSLEYTDTAGERHYSNLASGTSNGDWTEFSNVKFSFTSEVSKVYVYFECNDASTLYIDDFTLAEAPIIPIEEDIASLKDVYSGYFKVGTAVMASNLSSPSFMDLVQKHFSDSITFGNELKPDYVLDQAASQANGGNTNPQVNFSQADALLKYCAANKIPVRGHTLVWHSQTPDWFFKENFSDDGDWVDKDTMITRMENYIKNVMEGLATQYPDVEFYAWDVVNEAWQDNGTPRAAGSSKSENPDSSAWTRIFGDNSFIEYAFQFARKYAPAGCKLYYNDFNEYMPQKTTAIYDMAMELKEKGLIDGIGMQSHLDVGFPNASTYEKALSKFASTGLDIQITELDITTSDTSEAGLEKQAQMYSDIFDLCVKYKDNISAVVIWGVTDDQSWRATRVPLLFDENFKAKPAFYAIVDDVEPLDPITTTVTTTASSETTTTTTTEPDGNFIPGDVNFDKVVNGFDLSAMRQEWVGEAQYAPYLDMSQDGSFNAADVVALAKFLLGK
ncbi:endo-1,4-beta-xylanase [Ruminococcus sp. CAG:330]|uniref:endo-1,4-beta-xylanase n=1 Tax=Ruminococcus sp. CAG:330 TaxID=1262954 RepID=UPI0003352B9E|nr:endo-1,4-beta-xylanase [Ruminococcus sp. CAG:330]CDE13659.1 beta-1 4-xylanase [Ruminococcus sp. CAG:330]